MCIADNEKYWQWRLIADDEPEQWESIERIHEVISKDLDSKFVFVDKSRNSDIADFIESRGGDLFIKGFQRENIAVYEVK